MFLLYLYVFIIGSSFASFINVIVWRMIQGISFVRGRSFCPKCHKILIWKELIPIFSYIFLKGKCSKCENKIPVIDVVIEIIGGCIGIFCFYYYLLSWEFLLAFSVFMLLLLIALMDIKTMEIPNTFILALCVPVFFSVFIYPETDLFSRISGVFIVSLPMYGLVCLIPDCFGGGDIKLMAAAGFLLGWKLTLLSFFIAILLGGCFAGYLLCKKKINRYSHIAFGPYICVGIAVSYAYGNEILHTYFVLCGFSF